MERNFQYLIYRVCERFKLNPWDFCNLEREQQDSLVAYEQIREVDEHEIIAMLAGVNITKKLG